MRFFYQKTQLKEAFEKTDAGKAARYLNLHIKYSPEYYQAYLNWLEDIALATVKKVGA